jgi:hypothetical protein
MNKSELQRVLDGMDPEQALRELAEGLRQIFPLLGEEARLQFVVNLVGESGADKVAGLVHL